GAYAVAAGNSYADEEGNAKLEIGVVGEIKEPYFDTMLFAVNNLSGSQIALKLTRMDEATAKRRLDAGEISSYVLVPDGFEDRMASKDPLPLTYVLAPTSSGVSTGIANEIIGGASRILLEGQNTMIGLRRYARANMPGVSITEFNNDVTNQFVTLLFSRENLFQTEEAGVLAGKGFIPYLLMSLSTFFVLIWGVSSAPLFSSRKTETGKLLIASGLGTVRQIAAEYLSYLALTLVGVFFAALIAGFGMNLVAPDLFHLLFADGEAIARFLLRTAVICVVFSALQFMLYELARGTVAALLLQTLVAVFLGYVSGCFYSSHFFPRALQRFSAFLPTGAAIQYLTGTRPLFGLVLAGYFVLFILVIIWKRRADLAGDAV
ncbi:MAG: ABC transporter permease, partial [Clostridia bacterium]|nr:ABC transporter permease [Clostridia bacterium]